LNYQQKIVDNISLNLTQMLYFLTDYSIYAIQDNPYSAIRATQWQDAAFKIQGNITMLISSNPDDELVYEMRDSFYQLLPYIGFIITPGVSNELIFETWGTLFNLMSDFLALTTNLTNAINSELTGLIQNLSGVMLLFIVSLIVFVIFIFGQVFGRTIKSSESLEKKGRTLKITNEALEKLVLERTKQLQDSERMATIGQTAGMVGHDIRTPLQAIVSEIYILQTELDAITDVKVKEEVKESLTSIETNVTYINKIVADLQDFSRPLKPEYIQTDFSSLIRTVFSAIQVPDNIRLIVDVKGELKLRTDPLFIRRALTNLVNNAIQAMPNGGKMELIGYQKENSVFIVISDTGGGIPEEVKSKLFTPLMSTKASGQGFGLAVTKRLIGALNALLVLRARKARAQILKSNYLLKVRHKN
jgi:signal transduction histidine kinase